LKIDPNLTVLVGQFGGLWEHGERTGTFTGVAVMLEIIEDNRAELERLCRRFHVRRLDLFGSAATGGFAPETSDLDFLRARGWTGAFTFE
jgi:hypothetical protein